MSDPVIIVPPGNPPVIVTPPGGGGTTSTNVIVGATTVGPQGPQGDKGDTGATGPTGLTGATGATGPAPTISVAATSLPSSSSATATTNNLPNPLFTFGIPRGSAGITPTSTGVPPTDTSVLWLDDTATAAYPTGPTGPQGPQGNQGIQGPTGPAGEGYDRTSTTSALVTYNATRTFTLVPDIGAYQVGTRVRVSSLTTLTHFIEGRINGVSGNTITVLTDVAVGQGNTYSNWSVNVAGESSVVNFNSPLSITASTRTLSIGAASTTASGAVQLTDSVSSTSVTTAATPNSVKTSYDLAVTASNAAATAQATANAKVSSVSGTGAISVTAGTTPQVSVNISSTSVAGVASFDNTNFTVSGAGAVSISAVSGNAVSGNISGNAGNVTGVVAIANGGTNASSAALARTNLDLTSTADLLTKFFNYPASGYDVFPRYFASTTAAFANAMLTLSVFTPLKTTTITSVTTQVGAGRLSYGFSAAYRGIGLYQCSGTNNTTLTPLAATWDGDRYLWATSNSSPGTSATVTTATASNSGNYTLVTCVGSGSTFTTGQWVTVSGGTGGFTTFTGVVVLSPSGNSWVLQRTGTSLVTGTMTGGTATGRSLSPSTCTITSGTVDSGTGTVATVSIVHSSMAVPFSPGQWVNVTGSTNSFSGVVSESPAPTSTGFTMTAPSTLTSGSVGTGSAVTPDAFGRYVRPLYTPTAGGTGFVTPASITLNAGTTYAVGMLDYQTGGTYSVPSIVIGPSAGINQLHLPYQSLGIAAQTGITTANVTGQTITSTMPWARFT